MGGAFKVAGDYSAVFPLLTVAVFVALQISRQTVFYGKQRSRGDIMALPEVLCEPGKEGKPLVMDYEGNLHELDESDYDYEMETDEESSVSSCENYRTIDGGTTQRDIEAQFETRNKATIRGLVADGVKPSQAQGVLLTRKASNSSSEGSSVRGPSPLPPRPQDGKTRRSPTSDDKMKNIPTLNTLDDLLNDPIERIPDSEKRHRRTRSEPLDGTEAMWDRKSEIGTMPTLQRKTSGAVTLKRVNSFGQVDQEQPSLLDQARNRAASFATAERTQKLKQKAARKNSTEY